jgi:hypothetical protein
MKQPSFFTQILQYLYIKKRNPDAPHNANLSFMHGMNRISIFMFIFAVVVIIYRLVVKR